MARPAKKRKDPRDRKTTSRQVRLNLPTIDLLDRLRKATLLHYGGYDRLVRELAVRELIRRRMIDAPEGNLTGSGLGLPARPSAPAGRVEPPRPAPGPLPTPRSRVHDALAHHGEAAGE